MKIAKVTLAATLALSALGVAGTASAKDHHHGWNKHHRHQVCSTVWRHHHRERVCHWVG